jgi:integrase/recombinase XerD
MRSHPSKTHIPPALADVARETAKRWRKHYLDDDQTKAVVERARRAMALAPPRQRRRTVERLDRAEVDRLIRASYQARSTYGLMLKTLFLTGVRVAEFVHLRVEDLRLDGDLPQIHVTHAKGRAMGGGSRYVPMLPSLAQEVRTHLRERRAGYLFESNRQTRYSVRAVQAPVAACARAAGITKAERVYPHFLRHSIATILLDSGQVPIDQVQKLLGHLQLSTTQIYAETSVRALRENYLRALSGPSSGPAVGGS